MNRRNFLTKLSAFGILLFSKFTAFGKTSVSESAETIIIPWSDPVNSRPVSDIRNLIKNTPWINGNNVSRRITMSPESFRFFINSNEFKALAGEQKHHEALGGMANYFNSVVELDARRIFQNGKPYRIFPEDLVLIVDSNNPAKYRALKVF